MPNARLSEFTSLWWLWALALVAALLRVPAIKGGYELKTLAERFPPIRTPLH